MGAELSLLVFLCPEAVLCVAISAMFAELGIQVGKKLAPKEKKNFTRTVDVAVRTIGAASKKVILVLGGQGAGKSTICKYMFGVKNAVVGTGNFHVTTELQMYHSRELPYAIVDTVGKMPDVRGMMRVIACAYNRGWDPAALVIVHSGRIGHFNTAASFLSASKINVIDFEPKSFWKMKTKSCLSTKECLDMTVSKGEGSLPFLQILTPDNYQKIKECAISENLLRALGEMDWKSYQKAKEYQGMSYALALYMAKVVEERANFNGSDLDFIESQEF